MIKIFRNCLFNIKNINKSMVLGFVLIMLGIFGKNIMIDIRLLQFIFGFITAIGGVLLFFSLYLKLKKKV